MIHTILNRMSIKCPNHNFRAETSLPLLYLGCDFIRWILNNNAQIGVKYLVMLLVLSVSSTLSDGFFMNNAITRIDRVAGLLFIIVTLRLLVKKGQKLDKNEICSIVMALRCLHKSRASKIYNQWNNWHFVWHLIVFDIIRRQVKKGIYLG